MKIAVYSCKHYDYEYFHMMNEKFQFDIDYLEYKLNWQTAITAKGYQAVCVFVNDIIDEATLNVLKSVGVKVIALRCAGFDNVDIKTASKLGLKVVRVPAYSPEAVAEHAVGLMLTLNRRIHKAYQRTRDANFSLEGLCGFNMHNRTAGIIGTGRIGLATMRILKGFGMNILAYDPYPTKEAEQIGAEYVDLDYLFPNSDVISLHCPMSPENHYLLNATAFNKMKKGVMIINTSRGGLLDASAAIEALKQYKIGSLGMDVYENEHDLFFEDKSNDVIQDDVFQRLSACHNVIFTGHQAFLTEEALLNISEITLQNIQQIIEKKECANAVN